jgi:hypothetical protein
VTPRLRSGGSTQLRPAHRLVDTHARLKQLARARKPGVNTLLEVISSAALAEFDAETRFRLRAAQGEVKWGAGAAGRIRCIKPRKPGAGPASANSALSQPESGWSILALSPIEHTAMSAPIQVYWQPH